MESRTGRRTFIIGAASAATSAARGAAQEQEVRTAFIGVGVRGGELLKQTLAQPNAPVKAICDIDPQTRDKAASAAARHSPKTLSDWRAVLDLKDVDAVYIATPCDLHAEMAAMALDAGKYVYCEKPLAINPEGVARVLRSARRAKTFLQIGQQLRYFPSMVEPIKQIHAGLVGNRYIIKAHRHSSRSRPRPDAPEPTPQAKNRTAWYADVRHSGDLIVENAIHNLDACNWLANSRPVSAYGHGKKYFPQPVPPGTVMMDAFSVEYIYENGMHCDYSQISFHPRQLKTLPSGMWYTVFGEKGSVYLTHSSATFYDIYGEGEPRELVPAGTGESDTAIAEFLNSVRTKREPFADVKVAAIAALTGIMGREAIYKGRSVTWKELGVEV